MIFGALINAISSEVKRITLIYMKKLEPKFCIRLEIKIHFPKLYDSFLKELTYLRSNL